MQGNCIQAKLTVSLKKEGGGKMAKTACKPRPNMEPSQEGIMKGMSGKGTNKGNDQMMPEMQKGTNKKEGKYMEK